MNEFHTSVERDLNTLRKRMSPAMQDEPYVFCCVPEGQIPAGIQQLATFREAEGLTLIVSRKQAVEANLNWQFECAWITLNVYSSLDAVGFTALISNALSELNIPCNVVSAYHHDHLFVPFESRERVMQMLQELTTSA